MPPQARNVALVHDTPKTKLPVGMSLTSPPVPSHMYPYGGVENTCCMSQARGLEPIWQFLNPFLKISACQMRNHRCPCLVSTVLNFSYMLEPCVLLASQNALRRHRCRSARKRSRLAKIKLPRHTMLFPFDILKSGTYALWSTRAPDLSINAFPETWQTHIALHCNDQHLGPDAIDNTQKPLSPMWLQQANSWLVHVLF